jgi:hypothetical protein
MRNGWLIIGSMTGAVAVGSLAAGPTPSLTARFTASPGGQASPLGQLEWMAGCWERTAGDEWLDEQ